MLEINYKGIKLPDGNSYQTAGEYVPYSSTVTTPISDASVQNLAPEYDPTSTYSVKDWCVYNGVLYQCNTAIATPEAFDSTKWAAKKIVETTGSDIPVSSGETETIAEAISAITSINSFERPNSNYGKFFFYEVNGIKIGVFQDPKSLDANKYTILDFTLPEKFRPKYREVYLTLFEPSAAYTVRCKIQTNGVVSIYNYGTRDSTINTSGIIPYV